MKSTYMALKSAILVEPTLIVRLAFVLLNLGYLLDMYRNTAVSDPSYAVLAALTPPGVNPAYFWTGLVVLYVANLIKGLTGQLGWTSFVFEGLLGVFIWSCIASAEYVTGGDVGVTTVRLLIAMWLFIRYPAHWRKSCD